MLNPPLHFGIETPGGGNIQHPGAAEQPLFGKTTFTAAHAACYQAQL